MAECPISRRPYKAEGEMRPMLLPCGHSVSQYALSQLLEGPQELRKCPFDRHPLHSRSLADYQVNYTLCSMLDERIESWRLRSSSLKVRSDRLLMNATGGNIYEGLLHHRDGTEEKVAVKRIEIYECTAADREQAMKELALMCRVAKHLGPSAISMRGFVELPGEAILIARERSLWNVHQRMAECGGKIDFKEAVVIAAQACDALVRLHEIGIVHRDVSPGNIMCTPTKNIALADFGISQICTTTLRIPQDTVIIGNIDYCSPEQTNAHVLALTDRTDVWCLAATILHAMTGQRPHGRLNMEGVIRRHVRKVPPEVPQNLGSRALTELLQKCFSFDPRARPSAAEMYRSLTSIIDNDGGSLPWAKWAEVINKLKDGNKVPASELPVLEELIIRDVWVGIEGARALKEPLAHLSNLHKLVIQNGSLFQEGASALAPALEDTSGLRVLELAGNKLGHAGAMAFAKVLPSFADLRVLNLRGNKLGGQCNELFAALASVLRLEQLDLSDNWIAVHALKSLVQSLTALKYLRVFKLNGNGVGPAGATALAKWLEQADTLVQLGISENRLGVEGVQALVSSLEKAVSLETLNMSGNCIEDEGAGALARTLGRLQKLQILRLHGNGITDEGALALVPALGNLNALQTLDLPSNSIGDEACNALKAAKPGDILKI